MSSLKISVVICTYNRAKFIGEALISLSLQDLDPTDFEIIIVNNNCTDNTEEICLHFIKEYPNLDVNYVIEHNQGLSFARNRGIDESKYGIISYIDDDAIAEQNFLSEIQAFFINTPRAVGVGGKVIPKYETQEPEWMSQYLDGFVAKMDKGLKQKKFSSYQYPVGCNMTYTKEILKKVGGFNNKLMWRADDKYIGIKVRDVSNEVYYNPLIVVLHNIDVFRISDKNFKDFCLKFGKEEAIRVKDLSLFHYFIKLIEYVFKLFASIFLMILFLMKGQLKKGIYVFKYRWWATIGLFNQA